MKTFARTFKGLFARHAVVVASVVVISVGGVGGIAYALTSGGSGSPGSAGTPSASGSSSGSGGATGTGSSGSGAGAKSPKATRSGSKIAALVGRAVHAEIVVPKSGGGYQTLDLDRGTVTSLSSTSVTIDSLDGGTPVTAAITSSTHEPKTATISQGEQVILVSSGGNVLILRPDTKANSGSSGAGSAAGTTQGSAS